MTVSFITTIKRFIGLSTDTKPTVNVPAGSTFLEYDTGNLMITLDDGTTWVLKSAPEGRAVSVKTIDLNQVAGDYDLFQAVAQALIIDFLTIIIPDDLSGELALTSISIQSTDVAPVVFLSAIDGAVANLDTAGLHLSYRDGDTVAATKKIQLTIGGGATAGAEVCTVYASYRAAVAGGYLNVL